LTESTDTPVELTEISVPGDRSVKPFELFFDLVFVFAFTHVTQLQFERNRSASRLKATSNSKGPALID